MDDIDRAQEREQKDRAIALAVARNQPPARDLEAEICNGCSYASKTSWGKACDGWVECLQDLQRRERAQ